MVIPLGIRSIAVPLSLAVVMMGAIAHASWASYRPPANIGRPGNREGAATRIARPMLLRESTGGTESCLTEPKQTVVALVPKDNNGLSSTPTPTLYSFIPANRGAALTLTLRDSQGTEVYRQERPAPTEAGIVGWPVENVSLKKGVDYQWELTLTCTNGTTAIKTASWFRLMPLSPSQQQRIVQARDAAAAFAMAGYWYDALNQLAKQRLAQPEDTQVQQKWQALLQSPAVQLANLANQPLVPLPPQP
ncbi:DUF928 domain-containing protein [Thermosynechococcus sp. HN-54]|uniref:DUF928 domain-containing protein n=1 Tax=Thermosynechococcus sp. HN-54 TaxID=2933959 RepID=UPI00202CD1B5|nr:DUF928 domain-containing protein [Thermosynechococcus sp. HN-54]URR35073.1 DUF928 domain-containing protein [Thermosynechococcus sp. HN-54]